MALFRKKTTNGSDTPTAVVALGLDAQIARAEEAKRALEALVKTAQTHIADLPETNASLSKTDRRANDVAQRLDSLVARVEGLEKTFQQTQSAEARVLALENSVEHAEERFRKIDRQQSSVEKLVALAQTATTQLDGLKQETTVLRQLEERLPRFRKECQPLFDQHAALKNDLDSLRTGITTLAQEAESGRETALKARAHATKVTEQVAELERKLEPLSEITTLGKDTDAHLRTLNALAEHVAAKVKALETQQSVVEHALLESRRVHEMVWEMEVQLKKLDEGRKRVAHVEEMLADLERMQAEANKSLEETSRARETFGREAAQHERGARMLMDAVQGHIDQLSVHKQEVETVHERLRVAQNGIAAAETRIDAVTAREQVAGPARGAHHGVGDVPGGFDRVGRLAAAKAGIALRPRGTAGRRGGAWPSVPSGNSTA